MSVDFNDLLAHVNGLVRELRTIHSTIRRTRNAVAKELRLPLTERVIKNTTEPAEIRRCITPEFAEFAHRTEGDLLTNSEAMAIIAKYVSENALISEAEPSKILLDRRLKVLLGLNRYHEPNATYAFLLQHVDSLFMHTPVGMGFAHP